MSVYKQKGNDSLYCEHRTRVASVQPISLLCFVISAISFRNARGLKSPKSVEKELGGWAGTPERWAGVSRRPSCLSVGGAGGAKVPFLHTMICFPIVTMIQQRSYKLKTSNI